MARVKRRHSDESEFENETEDGTPEAMERTSRQAHRMQSRAFDAFDMFNGPMARLMDQNWSMFQKTVQAMQAESLKFVNRRLEHTGHTIENSRDCDGISGFLTIQQEWMVEFARDYAEQTKRLAELMRELAEDGASSLSSATSEIAERGRNEHDGGRGRAAA